MAKTYIVAMSASRRRPPHQTEAEADRRARLSREAEMIAEARAEVARGDVVEFDEVAAWVESWDTDHELPMPQSKRPR
jgi:predicted transcriptional regulator